MSTDSFLIVEWLKMAGVRGTRDVGDAIGNRHLCHGEQHIHVARAIVQSGWNLTELKAVGESLEDVFLDLTRSENKEAAA